MPQKRPYITDHALLRYLERIRGFSFERECEEIRKICSALRNTDGTVKYQGCNFEVKNGRVITVTPDNGHPTRTKRMAITGATS